MTSLPVSMIFHSYKSHFYPKVPRHARRFDVNNDVIITSCARWDSRVLVSSVDDSTTCHYNDVIMSAMASQATSLTIVCPSFIQA